MAEQYRTDFFTAAGVQINQDDWPWWCERIRGWLLMVKQMQEATGPAKGIAISCRQEIEANTPQNIYNLYKRYVATMDSLE